MKNKKRKQINWKVLFSRGMELAESHLNKSHVYNKIEQKNVLFALQIKVKLLNYNP